MDVVADRKQARSTSRRAAAPADRTNRRSVETGRTGSARWMVALGLVVGMIVGAGLGALLIRQRYRSHDVVVAVNGKIITKDEFFTRLQKQGGAVVLRQMVNEELVLQYAAKKGLLPTDSAVNARYAAQSRQRDFK